MNPPLTREQIFRRLDGSYRTGSWQMDFTNEVLAMLQEEREDCAEIARQHVGYPDEIANRILARGQPKPEPVKHWPCEHIVKWFQDRWMTRLHGGWVEAPDCWLTCPICGAKRP